MTTQEIALKIIEARIRSGNGVHIEETVQYAVKMAKLLQELTKEEGETKWK